MLRPQVPSTTAAWIPERIVIAPRKQPSRPAEALGKTSAKPQACLRTSGDVLHYLHSPVFASSGGGHIGAVLLSLTPGMDGRMIAWASGFAGVPYFLPS